MDLSSSVTVNREPFRVVDREYKHTTLDTATKCPFVHEHEHNGNKRIMMVRFSEFDNAF